MKRNGGLTNSIVVQMSRAKDSLSISSADQSSTLSISMESTLDQDSMTLQDSDSDTVSFHTAKSFQGTGMEHHWQLAPPPGFLQTVRPVSLPSAPLPVFLPSIRPASVALAPPGILPTLHAACTLRHFPDPSKS